MLKRVGWALRQARVGLLIIGAIYAVSLASGILVAGLDGRPGRPKIWMLYIAVRDSITTVKRLREWAAYVRPRER
jgi:predicted enzyme related to lactoylglutathione lyase